MDASVLNADNVQPRVKVSIITRLVAGLVYTIPAIGAALGSLLLINMFRLLRANEVAGISSLMKGMNEASLPVIVSLYAAAFFGIALIIVLVVRMIVQTRTASPPFWFFVVSGLLSLVPAGFFWKSQLLVLDAISPGTPTGSGGIGGVAAEISELLLIGLVLAPVVFIVLVVLSVIPLKSRPGTKWGSLIAAVLIELMLIATAVAVPFLIDGPKRKNEIVELPANFKNADSDYDVQKDTSIVLTMGPNNKLYQRLSRDKAESTETVITKEELPAKLEKLLEGKTPDKRIVYFKCDINAVYENVLQVLDIIRKADVDKVGLVVVGEKNKDDPYQIAPLIFDVRLPGPADNAARSNQTR
jgi:biopolymer transport protein ExbD